jgi:hypothetical protein
VGSSVELFWLPLGAGGHSVRVNGQVYEALVALRERRPQRDLYHSALVVAVPEGVFTIESAPIPDPAGAERGVVAEGPVGNRLLARFRIFRYELRCWRGGVIPDLAEAVDSPRRLTDDERIARSILDLMPLVPTPVWGLDELGAGEMWNSNSLISWLLVRAGLDVDTIDRLPAAARPAGTPGSSSPAARRPRNRSPPAGVVPATTLGMSRTKQV